MANGPDGCLWVIDMYRELIEGAAFLAPAILKHMDVGSGVDRGRIWRIVPDGRKRSMPKLSKATTATLVALLEHSSGWRRDTASRLLYQRQDRSAVIPLRQLAKRSNSPLGRTHALYAARRGCGSVGGLTMCLAALSDREPRVREHALRLAEHFCKDDQRIQARTQAMVADSDALVRYQLAFSLGAQSGTTPAPALAALAVSDGDNPWIRVAILSSVTGCADDVLQRLAGDVAFRNAAQGGPFLTALAGQTAASRPADVVVVLKVLDGPLAEDQALARGIVKELMSKMSTATQAKLARTEGGRVHAILAGLLADARQTAVDEKKPAPARAGAVRSLRFAGFADVHELLTESLASRQPAELQTAAVETLASFDDARGAAILLKAWPGMSPKLRATAAEAALRSLSFGSAAFLDAIENGHSGPSRRRPGPAQSTEAVSR